MSTFVEAEELANTIMDGKSRDALYAYLLDCDEKGDLLNRKAIAEFLPVLTELSKHTSRQDVIATASAMGCFLTWNLGATKEPLYKEMTMQILVKSLVMYTTPLARTTIELILSDRDPSEIRREHKEYAL